MSGRVGPREWAERRGRRAIAENAPASGVSTVTSEPSDRSRPWTSRSGYGVGSIHERPNPEPRSALSLDRGGFYDHDDAALADDAYRLYAVLDGECPSRGLTPLENLRDAWVDDDASVWLAAGLRSANEMVLQFNQAHERKLTTGATVAALAFGAGGAVVAHLGDSRVYRYHHERLDRLTTDHTLANERLRTGRIAPEDATEYPHARVLTRALGLSGPVDIDGMHITALPRDRFLLCNDGVWSGLPEETIAEVLATETLVDAPRELVKRSRAQGSREKLAIVVEVA